MWCSIQHTEKVKLLKVKKKKEEEKNCVDKVINGYGKSVGEVDWQSVWKIVSTTKVYKFDKKLGTKLNKKCYMLNYVENVGRQVFWKIV